MIHNIASINSKMCGSLNHENAAPDEDLSEGTLSSLCHFMMLRQMPQAAHPEHQPLSSCDAGRPAECQSPCKGALRTPASPVDAIALGVNFPTCGSEGHLHGTATTTSGSGHSGSIFFV